MLEFTTHKFLFLKRKEFWFYDSEKISRSAYSVFCYSLEKYAKDKQGVLKEQTSLIDLKNSKEKLYSQISRTFKHHIHKAESIGVETSIEYFPTKDQCLKTVKEFGFFANQKSIEWSAERIYALQRSGNLVISTAFLKEQKINTHIYLHDNSRVVLLHSYPDKSITDKKITGYANKFLHWQDILSFKTLGLNIYDFGGINAQQHPGITKFKLSFGGEVENCYSYIETNPILALAISFIRSLKKK